MEKKKIIEKWMEADQNMDRRFEFAERVRKAADLVLKISKLAREEKSTSAQKISFFSRYCFGT
jgi:hypothetical protein